jgi:hypothetical protein
VFAAPSPSKLGGQGVQLAGAIVGRRCLGVGCIGRGLALVGLGILQGCLVLGGRLRSCHLL